MSRGGSTPHTQKGTYSTHTHTQTSGQWHGQHDTQLCRLLLAVWAMKPEGTNCTQPAQETTAARLHTAQQ